MNNNNVIALKSQADKKLSEIVMYNIDELENIETKEIYHSFIVEEGVNLYVASAGSGKTMLLYAIMTDYMRKGKTCYYVDLDNPADLPKDRGLIDVVKKDGLVDRFYYFNTIHYLRYSEVVKNATYGKFLRDVLDEANIGDVIFIDSIQNFIDVNDQNIVLSFMKLLRQYSNSKRLTIFCIHHVGKVSGKYKGHTQIEDMSDSVYNIKPLRDDNIITGWLLEVQKQRYRTASELTIGFNNEDFTMNVSDVAIQDNTTLAILRYAVSYLRKNENVKQSTLIDEIKKKFSSVGDKKIFYILKEYADKGLFVRRQGVGHTYYYDINMESKYLLVLFNNELSKTKKDLLEAVLSLALLKQNLTNEVRLVRADGSITIFNSVESIKRSIFKFTDDEAKYILDELQKNLKSEVYDNNMEAEDDFEVDF